jgi:hypothetical protein
MAVPARPVGGASIESAWGTVVHDAAVAMDMQAGGATVTVASGSGSTTVVFPRPFASAPIVVASVNQGATYYVANVGGISATSCQVVLRDIRDAQSSSGPNLVTWIAYGPRA